MFKKPRILRTTLLCLFVLMFAVPTFAQVADVKGQVETFFKDIEGLMITVATSAAIIGFLGLALMNLGASIPMLAEWKQENPKAARNVMTGLIILIFVGSGGLVGLLSFS